MSDARSALAALRPPAGADEHVWAARITACWRASVEAILEVGRLLVAAKEALPHGKFGEMIDADLPFSASTAQRLMTIAADQRISNPAHVQHLPPSWGTLYELTKLPDEEFERGIADGTIKPDMMRRDIVARHHPAAEKPAPDAPATIEHDPDEPARTPEHVEGKLPQSPHNAQRVEDADSDDYSPTPPWATRALFQHVLAHLGVRDIASAWDPACGEGHMTSIMEEYVTGPIIGTDIHDYSFDGKDAPGWLRQQDFLDEAAETPVVDWIITNPPFGDRVRPFMGRALNLAKVGVAIFMQLRFLEGVDRYNAVFRDKPPTLIAPFVERVPLHMGRYEPDGSTMTAFMWLVWIKDRLPMAPFWIPPSRRVDLRRKHDDERFTAHPVHGIPYGDRLKVIARSKKSDQQEYPEGRSGTAREAPSTGIGTTAETPSVGVQPAAPLPSNPAPAPGEPAEARGKQANAPINQGGPKSNSDANRDASSLGNGAGSSPKFGPAPTPPPVEEDDGLAIPAFLDVTHPDYFAKARADG